MVIFVFYFFYFFTFNEMLLVLVELSLSSLEVFLSFWRKLFMLFFDESSFFCMPLVLLRYFKH